MNKEVKLQNLRHTLAHLLAAAVRELYPKAKNAIGPAIEDGFYQDFDLPQALSEKDFPKLEQKMRELLKKWSRFEKKEVSIEDAKKEFAWNEYKTELIKEFAKEGKTITFHNAPGFVDLCKGGHVTNPNKEIKTGSWKLDRVAGAYWRGDEKNKMLTRIYGLAFEDPKELEQYEHQREEARKRDHRKLGRELDLFTFSDRVGSGLPLFTPRGALIRKLVNDYVEKLQSRAGYTQVWTPQIAKAELFKTSGHYNKYKEDMFRVVSNYSDEEFYLKPMNCPQHTQIYESKKRSYRDLPIRYSDFAMLYRDERPGELSGLARVRSFAQDDCHIFCREDQVDEEIDKALDMTKKVMATFGFKYKYRLSTRDPKNFEKYLGNPKIWDKVETWAEKIMKRNKIAYIPGPGEAAFYAPKMDLIATDILGRDWQLSTVQIDYVMPERFALKYVDKDGKEKHPVMIHRAIIGSSERFLMILLEHYAGNFPLWLAPVQVKVIPVRVSHNKFAKEIYEMLKENDIRAELDDEDSNLGPKVRSAKNNKVPYWLVIGDKELKTKKVTLESRDNGNLGQLSPKKLLEKLTKEIQEKK